MKKWLKFFLPLAAFFMLTFAGTCGGDTNADKASENLGERCERFECQRRIIAYNGITDKVILDVEGRCNIEGNKALPNNLELVCKHGKGDFKKHFVGLADNVSWTSTQLESLKVSEYRTKFVIRPESFIPDLDLVTGDQVPNADGGG